MKIDLQAAGKQAISSPMFRFLAVLTVANAVGFQSWLTLFNNFSVEVAGLLGNQVGVIQSVREIPGFLTFGAIFVMILIKEHRLSALSILILGLGMGVTGLFPSMWGIMATTCVFSFGFHYFETTKQSLGLQYFDKSVSPYILGKLRSYDAATNIFVGVFIFFITPVLSYTGTYGLVGVCIVLAGLWAFVQDPTDKNRPPQLRRMVFRKRYWLYYVLTFMAGARRQIFMAFAVFLLVKRFEFSIREVTVLFVVNNIINYFLAPLVGKAIVRFGERRVLTVEYASLLFVFLAYAQVGSRFWVAVLYILDHVFFSFALAINTYFQKIGDIKDIAPSMAVGFTINHIAAVVLPALGGILWMIDYRIVFVAGAAMSLVSLILVQQIPMRVDETD